MKGVYSKNAINSLVEPLTTLTSVFGEKIRVVYECEDEKIFISIKNTDDSIFSICEIQAKDSIQNYSVVSKELSIWEVSNLIKLLKLFERTFYTEDLEIDVKLPYLVFKCGNDVCKFQCADNNIINEQKANIRTFNTEKFNQGAFLTLNGEPLRRTIAKFSTFDSLDLIQFSGEKGKPLKISLINSSNAIINTSETTYDTVICDEDFELKFPKTYFKGLLTVSDAIDLTVYIGKRNLLVAEYTKDNYNMKFFFAELINL